MSNKPLIAMLTTVLRVGLGVGLLAFLFHKIHVPDLSDALNHAGRHPGWLVMGIAMTFLGLMLGALRWHRILDAQGIAMTRPRVVRIFFIGQFFNAFMLGACGGDVVRAYYAAQGQVGRRAEAATTIFLDRAIGLLSTILFCCVMILVRMPVFIDNEGPRDTGLVMVVFLLVSLAGLFVAFRQNLFERFAFFRRLEQDTPIGPLLRRVYEAVYMYRSHHAVLRLVVFMSLLNLASLTMACWCFGRALELPASLLDHVTLFPIITVLMAIPLTPGSLGVRESLFVSLFRSVMVTRPSAIMLSLMVYAGGVLWSLVGGLLYLSQGGRPEHPLPEEAPAVQG